MFLTSCIFKDTCLISAANHLMLRVLDSRTEMIENIVFDVLFANLGYSSCRISLVILAS